MSAAAHRHPRDQRRTLVLALVALTWASAVIHAVAVPAHLREWGAAGAFFAAVALAQLAWAAQIHRRPTRGWLLAGLCGNAALVGIWLVSRTVGVPLGPEAGDPEALGAHDALATLNEAFAIGFAGLLLTGRTLPKRITSRSAGSLAAASLLAVVAIPPHSHGSSHAHGSPSRPATPPQDHHGGSGHAHDGRGHAHR